MENFLQRKLQERVDNDSLRTLQQHPESLADFHSNDYLSFAQSHILKQKLEQLLQTYPNYKLGSTGSRLLAGNGKFVEELEQKIAGFHEAEASLIFNSGYDANIGLLSCIAQRGDTIVCDELIHASLIDGARLSLANKYTFAHNNLTALEDKLKLSKGNVFIVTESVFSMDGDTAPLLEINELAIKYNANLIVDEAHAIGVIGNNGVGLCQQLGIQDKIFARIYTFGKALGCHGAVITGSVLLKTYLINFARSFIYTTALPFHALASITVAYSQLYQSAQMVILKENIALFKHLLSRMNLLLIPSESAIQSIIIEGNSNCKNFANYLQQHGCNVKAILSPTVPAGKERLRISLHAHNTKAEIYNLTNLLSALSKD
ncbi:aminotransferase class I/II-fold pyridoxal phosphate-dependent enzyme [Pedobacter alpinus]|uniref:Aminotransferase class I/II-fold pyridoxal phosphate-dependent enzyme n=1 Tax=Pedobacter alpinus TaxID=1590643 RepID=A0ABW5TNJ7_9SPHI